MVGLVFNTNAYLIFFYWCGRVSHGERDCAVWLRGKGNLKKEDQPYGEWMQAEQFKKSRKSVAMTSGSSCGEAPWGIKYKTPSGSNNGQFDYNFLASFKHGSKSDSASTMKSEPAKE